MKFSIVDESDTIVSIDVLEVATGDVVTLKGYLVELLNEAKNDPDFIEAALHYSLPPLQQPLAWLGWVPMRSRFLALYTRWRDGHRRAFAASDQGRDILKAACSLTRQARPMLNAPEASLYLPALLDATGELCPGQSDCVEGHGVGPIIDSDNTRAQFINVFETTPDRQDALLHGTFGIMPVARRHEGYLRTALHRSIDGAKVANYGQYRRAADIRAMYFQRKTAFAFGELLFKDVTKPASFLGRPVRVGGHVLGTAPALRCYTVEKVIVTSDMERPA